MRNSIGRIIGAATVAVAALLLSGCGGGGGGDSDPAPEQPTARASGYAQLAQAGGTVHGTDGARIVVPADAMARPGTVAISRDSTGMPEMPAGTAPISDVWSLTPHGTRFKQPVTVRIPFDASRLAPGEKPVLLKGSLGGGWQLIENVRVDGSFVEVDLRSFSFLFVQTGPVGGILVPPGGTPSPTQPRFSVTLTNGGFPALNVTGFTATMHQQPSPTTPANVQFNLRVPSASALASFCGPGEANQLQVSRHTLPVTTYHLPGDGAGVNRLAAYFREASASALVLNPTAATEAEQRRLPLDTDIVVNQSVNAMDYTWRELPTQHSSYYYGWADALWDELPPGAVVDAWGVMVKLVLSCGAYGLPVMPDTAPPVIVVRGFANDVILIDGPPTLNAAFPGQQVEATLNTVIAPNFELGRVDWVVKRPGSSTWEGVPGVLSATPPGGLTMWNSGGTLRLVASLADNGTRIRAQACAEVRADLINNPAITQGLQASGCATSAEGTITVANQFPQARIVTQPGPAAWRTGDLFTLRAEFEAFPIPPRTAANTVVWQTRANANAPWGGLPDMVDASLAPSQATTKWIVETRPLSTRTDRAEAWALSYQPVTMADNGRQFRIVVNLPGTTLTSDILTVSVTSGLAPPVFTTQPAAVTVQSGSAATLAAAVSGGTPMSYRWLLNGQPITGANAPTLALPTVNSANAGDYVLEASNAEATVRSNPARLTVTAAPPAPVQPPSLLTSLTSITVPAGSTAGFSVNATGGAPLDYQWRRNGEAISGATEAVLTLPNVTLAQAGAYSVQVRNSAGSVFSGQATLTVGSAGPLLPPQIVTPPVGLTLNPGQSAVFAVAATGGGTLTYQWQRDGHDIAGATGPVLVLPNVQAADAGAYTVAVVNGEGRATSLPAGLVVLPPAGAPVLTMQPASTSAVIGQSVRLTAAASGNPTPICLWLRNGIVIAGATSCTEYVTPPLTLDDNAALYNVFAYSSGGYVFGNGALLTVTPAVAPAITAQPSSSSIPPGGSTSFTVTATGAPAPTIEWGVNSGLIGNSGHYVLGGCEFDYENVAGTLNIRNVTADCNGSTFIAQVRNLAGTALSDTATLSVASTAVTATLLAGSPGVIGSADGPADLARFSTPNYLTVARDGSLAIGDFGNSTIRIVIGTQVSTLAGTPGSVGFADGTGSAARFARNGGLAYNSAGHLFVADWDNHVIRRITPEGVVSTFAGSPGAPGSVDGIGSAARMSNPNGLVVDTSDNVYFVDWGNHTIRKITPAGVVSTFAGAAGQRGRADGTGSDARFNVPGGLAIDSAGNLYVTDMFNHSIRKITPAGEVSTLAGSLGLSGTADGTGSAARFEQPAWITSTADGTLFVISSAGDTVRRVTPAGVVETVVGVLGDSAVLRLGDNPRLRNARGLWAVSAHELLINADHALIRVRLP